MTWVRINCSASSASKSDTTLAARYVAADGTVTELGSVPVTDGSATVNLTVPATAGGQGRIVLTAAPSATTVTLPVTVVTQGLFIFIITGLMFWLDTKVVTTDPSDKRGRMRV